MAGAAFLQNLGAADNMKGQVDALGSCMMPTLSSLIPVEASHNTMRRVFIVCHLLSNVRYAVGIRDPNLKTTHHALSWDDESVATLRSFLDFFFFLSFSLLFFAFLSFLLCPCLCFSRIANASSTLPISAQR